MQLTEFCEFFHLNSLDKTLIKQLFVSFETSTFLARIVNQHPELLKNINWYAKEQITDINQQVKVLFSTYQSDLYELGKALRIFRQKLYAKIIFQHQHKLAHFEYIAEIISFTAKVILLYAQQYLLQTLAIKHKLKTTPPDLAIIAMGKLGGNELNFSSDIDLVFVYPNNISLIRESDSEYSPLRFYTELSQKLITLINEVSVDGFVYRVDMRLRPFGDGSPLASDFDSFKQYLIHHARDWERYAYIKSDIIYPKEPFKSRLTYEITQFVYRHYHDYRMLDSIREMKHKILTEMKQSTLSNNIKLGRGGIREIEFICQCFQLIYGGQNKTLQTKSLYQALINLGKANIITPQVQDTLYRHYVFLRNTENGLQMLDDQQVHTLPTLLQAQQAIASLSGYTDWQPLSNKIEHVRAEVSQLFDDLTNFNKPQTPYSTKSSEFNSPALNLTIDMLNPGNTQSLKEINVFLDQHDFNIKVKPAIKNLLLLTLNEYPNLLAYLFLLLRNLAKRQTYLFLLAERQKQYRDFLALLSYGQGIIDMLIEHPFLLERTLTHKHHDEVYLDIESLRNKLNIQLQNIHLKDIEAFLECLRRFKVEQIFNIIVSESRGHISLMESSDLFSYLATVIIEAALDGAWREVFMHSDIPFNLQPHYKHSLAIIAYGKLGGLELSVASDLDLVFIHDKIDASLSSRIFVRVIQKFIHFMQVKTYHGALYEVDLRLRPDGENGFVATSIQSYEQYLKNSAWTWEHQALTRARFICGDIVIQKKFDIIRTQTICQKRNIQKLKQDIINMRHKMRKHLLKVSDNQFDLKQSTGGMIDIEFIAQFYALAYSHKIPPICYYSDSIRIIQTMESAHMISWTTAQTLINHYCYYRDLGFKCYLNKTDPIVTIKSCQIQAKQIHAIWDELFITEAL